MNPFILAAFCTLLAYGSTRLLRYFATAVPIVLIGVPVILAGCAPIVVLSLLTGFGVAEQAAAVAALISCVVTFVYGLRLTSRYFEEAMKS